MPAHRRRVVANGRVLDAEYEWLATDQSTAGIEFRYWCEGGGYRKDYEAGLSELMRRFRRLDLDSVELDSKTTSQATSPERTLRCANYTFPVDLSTAVDRHDFLRELMTAAARSNRQKDARGSGNRHKTLLFRLSGGHEDLAECVASCESDLSARKRLPRKRAEELIARLRPQDIKAALDQLAQGKPDTHPRFCDHRVIFEGRSWCPYAVVSAAITAATDSDVVADELPADSPDQMTSLLARFGYQVLPVATPDDAYEEWNDTGGDDLDPESPQGAEYPERSEVLITRFRRLKSVCDAVRRRARGRCEACGEESGFQRTDGTPYLEVHHMIPLAHGGPDTVENAVGLCANCHARCHHASDSETFNDVLRQRMRASLHD